VYRVNSKRPVTIYCVLNKGTIEETMFDCVAVKHDAATICLLGKRIPRDFKPVDLQEVLAMSVTSFDTTIARDEIECELQWPKLRAALAATQNVALDRERVLH
jgi:hypothetical protein